MKRNIVIMNLAAAFLWMAMYIYVPILPAYATSVGASVIMIGIIGGAYGVLQIALRLPLGIISDKLNKDRLILIIGFAILALSNLLFVLQQDNVNLLIVARGMAGAAAAWWVVISASYTKYNEEEKQVKAQGILASSANVGKFVASLLCAVIAQFFGYHAVFVMSLVVAVIGVALMFGLKDVKTRTHEPVGIREQLSLLKNKKLWSIAVFAILSQILCFGTATTFTPVAAEELGASDFELGMIMLVFFLATAAGSLFVGTKAYKKLGGIHSIALSFLIGAASCIPVFYHYNMGLIYLAEVLAGICYGISQGATAGFVIMCVPAAQRGAATGMFQALFGIGIFLGPVITGYVIDGVSFDAAYIMTLVIMVASALLCYPLIPKECDRMT